MHSNPPYKKAMVECEKQKNYKSGLAPIYLRITVYGKRSDITANQECDPVK
jgi:hypothetical protein